MVFSLKKSFFIKNKIPNKKLPKNSISNILKETGKNITYTPTIYFDKLCANNFKKVI